MKALAEKVLVLGIDGLDPKLTKKYIEEGAMPNIQKMIERGSCREDLQMIGGQPTVTPPMWTTLATGANPCTHGITDYYAANPDNLGTVLYNFDSTKCKAEPMWNVAAKAKKKTLVWHWPGSSWPPTIDSPYLHVVDGTQPGGPNVGVAEIEGESLVIASHETPEVLFRNKAASDSNVPCFISGMEIEEKTDNAYERVHSSEIDTIVIHEDELVNTLSDTPMDIIFSPIKAANGWANVTDDAKEFTVLYSKGLIRRPALILKNEDGVYDTVQIYKNKKSTEPVVSLKKNVFTADIVDEAFKGEDKILANRNMRVLELSDDGNHLRMWISGAMDFTNDTLWYPKDLLKEITSNVGYPQPVSMAGGSDERLIADCTRANWDQAAKWNANSIKHLINKNNYELVFSHFHNVDLQGHLLVKYLKNGSNKLSAEKIQELFREVYLQTDRYVGEFLPLLDDGWTILIVSDHGQVCPEHDPAPIVSFVNAVNAIKFREWGYMVMKKDENGNDTHEIDWSKTKAVMSRVNHIYINLKGRDPEGIVDPEDKYELEEQIMTDLYSLRDKKTGHRVCQLALRNKEAILLGTGGPESGDIVYFIAEGYNDDHADSLSTVWGACDTTVSSVFIGAGTGIKAGYKTDRIVKHVDITPTVAVLTGLPMPAQCEGAPIYQIFE